MFHFCRWPPDRARSLIICVKVPTFVALSGKLQWLYRNVFVVGACFSTVVTELLVEMSTRSRKNTVELLTFTSCRSFSTHDSGSCGLGSFCLRSATGFGGGWLLKRQTLDFYAARLFPPLTTFHDADGKAR